MNIRKKHLKAIIYFILLIVVVSGNIIAQDNQIKINLVISNDIIGDVNKADAKSAMEFWFSGMMNEVSKKGETSQNVTISPNIVASLDEIKERINNKSADIIGLFTIDYIKFISELPITPIFIIQKNLKPGVKYILVVNKNSKIKSLSDLNSKKILTSFNRENEITEKWLYVEMKKEKIIDPYRIIDNFIKTKKPTKRLFQVFLGNADGCIISESQYESMCELNPQLKRQLEILQESPNFLTEIYFMNNNSQKEVLADIKSNTQELNATMNGSQVLKLFQAYKISNFEQKHLEILEALKTLFKEYYKYETK